MLKRLTWMTLMLVALVAFVGCSDDDDPVATPQPTAFDNIAEAVEAYLPTLGTSFITADVLLPMVNATPPTVTVYDIRTGGTNPGDHFAAGHIKGAVNVSLADILTTVTAASHAMDDNIVVACYTGQSAGHAVAALRLAGYTNAKTLKFGMSSWNENVAGSRWAAPVAPATETGSCMDALEAANIEATANDLVDEFDYPTGQGTVAEQLSATLASFEGITIDAMEAGGLDNYFIMNYVKMADYDPADAACVAPGHVKGAFQFTPGSSIDRDELMKNLPSDGTTIVVYCYTGQSSSQVTYALNAMGYTAKSLKFGMNHLFYNHADYTAGSKWDDAFCEGYDLYDNAGNIIP